jgi:hypothetical protein
LQSVHWPTLHPCAVHHAPHIVHVEAESDNKPELIVFGAVT